MWAKIEDHRKAVVRKLIAGVSICSLVVCLVLVFSYTISGYNPNLIGKPYSLLPEYKRFMKKIVISLAIRDTTLGNHLELLKRLPDYSEIILLLPMNNLHAIKSELKDQPFKERVQLVPFPTNKKKETHFYFLFPERDKLVDSGSVDFTIMPQGTLWAQDLFEVATKPDGRPLLLISDIHKWFNSYDNKLLKVVNDNSYLDQLSSAGFEVKRLPLTFNGGNILIDELKGKRIVFCGGDVLRRTRTVWKSTRDLKSTDKQITGMLKEFLKADEIVVIGRAKEQPSLLFHLDQAMIILPNGVVGITRIVGKRPDDPSHSAEVKDVEMFLSLLRSILLGWGYRLVDIDTSTQNVLNHQYHVNAIPYIDAETGQRTLLMPVFPATQTQFERELVKRNIAAFESIGYEVVPVPTKAYKLNGGIHCLVNVLE